MGKYKVVVYVNNERTFRVVEAVSPKAALGQVVANADDYKKVKVGVKMQHHYKSKSDEALIWEVDQWSEEQ
jgi:hypothetical protein